MKKIIVLSLLLLPASIVFAQRDTVKTKVVSQTVIKTNAIVKPARVRMKEIESIFNQMEKKLNELNVLVQKLKDNKDAIGEMNEQDMLMLQQLMEKKNQLETMISNTMKAGFEGGQAAIQALKAS